MTRMRPIVAAAAVASLTVNVVGDGAAGVTVTMDGAPVPSALVGVAQAAARGSGRLRGRSLEEITFSILIPASVRGLG